VFALRSGFSYNLDIRTAEFSGREAFWAEFQAKRRYPAVQKRETQVEPPSSLENLKNSRSSSRSYTN
jgi:hypothetical protein